MIFEAEYYQNLAKDLHERERSIKAARGRILDRNGTVLADNQTVCTISVIHSQIKDPEGVIDMLCEELKLPEETVRKRDVYKRQPNDQMIFSVQELKDKGFSYYKINQMVDKGILIKLNKKYYENVNFDGEESDFYYAYAFVPDGVVCLLSAAVYYLSLIHI